MRLAVAAFFVWLAAGALLLGAGGALGTTEEDASVPDALPLLALAAASSEVVVVGRTVVVAPADVTVRELETLTVVRVLWETPDDAEAAPEEVWWPLCFDESVELAELWSDADALPDAEDEAGLEKVEKPVAVGAAVAGPEGARPLHSCLYACSAVWMSCGHDTCRQASAASPNRGFLQTH